jgi:hypothetical protein
MTKNPRNIATLIAVCLLIAVVVSLSRNATLGAAPGQSNASPDSIGPNSSASEYQSGVLGAPTPSQTMAEIPIEVLTEQERLANEAMSMAPTAEASAGTDSNIPKFECTAQIFSEKSAGKQVVVLQVTAPKSVKSVWADIQIGSAAYQLEVKINNGFSRSVVGEIRAGEKSAKSVKIYSVPVFNKEMILCED